VIVYCTHVCLLMCSFAAADLDDVFKANIIKASYDKPTPIQKWAIPAIMRGRDLMACAQTGSGKTVSISAKLWSDLQRMMVIFLRIS